MTQQEMIQQLKNKGLKLTPQRVEIVRTLYDTMGDHPSLNSLHDSIRKRMPTVSFSTLYNTISTLEKVGLIRLFDLRGETRIEMNMAGHLNIIHSDTGDIVDVGDEDIVKRILSELDDDIDDENALVNVILYSNRE